MRNGASGTTSDEQNLDQNDNLNKETSPLPTQDRDRDTERESIE
jgi:hypothetical protein